MFNTLGEGRCLTFPVNGPIRFTDYMVGFSSYLNES